MVQNRAGTVFGNFNAELAQEAFGLREHGLHEHTVGEELRTLVNRHMQRTPEAQTRSKAWRLLRKELRKLNAEIGVCSKTPIKDIIKNKPARAKHRFLAGVHEVKTLGLQPFHSKVKCMQKLELHDVTKLAGKEDRAIQYRSTAYNSEITRYLWQIEHRCFNQSKYNGFRWSAKGLTKARRAVLLMKMATSYEDPVFICADHSRFDAHVNVELLKEEHRFYNKCYSNKSYSLKQLLKQQLINVGETKGGIKYKCVGKRMSGDCNTALGNSVLNYGMLAAWLSSSGVKGNILLDGDDSVIVVNRSDLAALDNVQEFMLRFGMVTEAEVVDDIREAEFCQSRVVLGRVGPYFCPNPIKILDTIRRSPYVVDKSQHQPILRASIACELIANPGMPLMKPYWKWLSDHPGPSETPAHLQFRLREGYGVDDSELWKAKMWKEPTDEERLSFAKAWGISPMHQVAIEEELVFQHYEGGREARFKRGGDVPVEEARLDEWSWDTHPDSANDEDLTQLDWENLDSTTQQLWIKLLT